MKVSTGKLGYVLCAGTFLASGSWASMDTRNIDIVAEEKTQVAQAVQQRPVIVTGEAMPGTGVKTPAGKAVATKGISGSLAEPAGRAIGQKGISGNLTDNAAQSGKNVDGIDIIVKKKGQQQK